MLSSDALGHRDALFLGLVRQHRATHDVADRPHVRQVGPAFVIDRDRTALVELQAHRVAVQTDGVRHAADRDDQLVDLELAGGALGVGVIDRDAGLARGDLVDLDPELDHQALLGEGLVRFLRDLLIDRAEEGRQAFEHRHLRAEATPDRAHLQPDHARADHAQGVRHRTDAQRTVVRQDLVLVERSPRQRPCIRARRDDDVLAADDLVGGTADLDVVASIARLQERASTVEEGDLVLLEQVQDAVVVLLHHRILAAQHLGHVDGQVLQADAVIGKAVLGMLEVLAGLQQRLRWNAADIGAGAAGRGAALVVLPLVDARCAEAELRGADRGHVTARAATDDDHVELLAHEVSSNQISNSRRAGSSSASFIATSPSTASRPSMMRWSYDIAR